MLLIDYELALVIKTNEAEISSTTCGLLDAPIEHFSLEEVTVILINISWFISASDVNEARI